MHDRMPPPRPTGEQCENQAVVAESPGRIAYAGFTPQIAGYHAKAVAVFHKDWLDDESNCGGDVELHVWHDGEFPTSDEEPYFIIEIGSTEDLLDFAQRINALNMKHEKHKE